MSKPISRKFRNFFDEVVEEIVEMRTANFDREHNIDDAYTIDECKQDVTEYLKDKCEADDEDVKMFHTDKWINSLHHDICLDLEDHYKLEDNSETGLCISATRKICPKTAVCCKTFKEKYCAECICERMGGSWCNDTTCESCNDSRVADAIEAAKEEAEEVVIAQTTQEYIIKCTQEQYNALKKLIVSFNISK